MSTGLVGRDRELEMLRSFLAADNAGAAAVLIEGEGGIGKTTIWRAAIEESRAAGSLVLTSLPSASESPLSFRGLIDLLDPVADEVSDRLPEPQRLALQVALLRANPVARIEPGAVSVAVLSALKTLSEDRRLIIAIDDVQWLDTLSERALAFALRRLPSDRVRTLATHRSGSVARTFLERALSDELVQRIDVGPISPAALYQLVLARVGVALPRPALMRVHQDSGGNPLVGLEFAREIARKGTVEPGRPLPLPSRLGELLDARMNELPASAQRFLVAIAAAPGADLERLARTIDSPHPLADLDPAVQLGLVSVDHGVPRLTHPLLAAAAYDSAGMRERTELHRKLAETATDPEDRGRHLAMAATTPDRAVADAVKDAATHAAARGATDVAAELAERALALTPRDDDRILTRTLDAARLALSAGDRTAARRHLRSALASSTSGPQRAEVLLDLAQIADPLGDGIPLCEEAARQAASDPALLSRIHRLWGTISYFLGRVADAEHHAELGVRFAEEAEDRNALGPALAELAHWTYCGGGGVRGDLFDRAIELDPSPGAASPRSHQAKVLMDADELDRARPLLEELMRECMEAGDLPGAGVHELHLAELESWAGNWALAIELANDSLQLRQHADQASAPLYVTAMAYAMLGRVDEARREAAAGRAEAERNEDVVFVLQNLHVLGFIELSLGDHRAATAYLGRATDLLRPRWSKEFGDAHVVPDEIETLVALGDLDAAADLLAWMETVAACTGRAWTRATAGRCRALFEAARGDLDAAEAVLADTLLAHEQLPMPFEKARTLMVRGMIERRRRRWADARTTLSHALEIFERLGSPLWSDKVRVELARIGTRTKAERGLSPVEERIAELATKGATNREIAERLSLSPKTVEANLSRIYRKLGIRSRAQLAEAVSARKDPSPHP